MDVSHLIVGLGSLIAGLAELKKGVDGGPGLQFSGFGRSKLPALPRPSDIGKQGQYRATIKQVGSIDSRVRHVISTIQKGRKDPRIRAFAVKAVSQKCGNRWCVPERDWWGEARALFGAIRQNVRYVRDIHKIDTFQAPRRTLEFSGGDCDDYSITLGSALQSIGYPIKVRIVQSTDSPDYNHIFLLVGMPPRDPRTWYSLDASMNKPAGWHPPRRMLSRMKDYDVP